MFSTAIQISKFKRALKISATLVCLSTSCIIAQPALATIVQFQTVLGDFSVNLYDKGTPKTVENFLAYVRAGAYTNTFIHRSAPGFVVQGGGFKYPWAAIPQNAAVVNEPVYANKRGTIAMAKGKDVNSATNQWFFNLEDNSKDLDANNGGYTVFGEVMGNGMGIINSIAALKIINYDGAPLNELPVRGYSSGNVTDQHLVMILGVVILDENIDTLTAANVTPAKTTYTPSDSGGGGAINWASLSFLMLLSCLTFMGRSRC